MSRRSVVPFLACSAALTWSAAAMAHVRFISPQPRHPTPMNSMSSARIKTSPCGCSPEECPNGDVRDPARVTVFEPGQTIVVQFAETIQHPGFYRISFDEDGQDAFEPPPTSRSAIQMGTPMLPVLKDNITDTNASSYMVEVTLPNVECENCTLQLIQVMTTDQSWSAEDDIYYTCADIALRSSAGGAGGMGSGGMSSGGMSAGGMAGGGTSDGGMAGGGMSAGGMGAGGTSAGESGSAGAGGASAGGAGGAGAGGAGAGGTDALGGAGMAAAAGGMASAGMPPVAGGPSAGAPATGGATGGVAAGATGGTAPTSGAEEEAGCGCRVAPRGHGFGALALAAGALAAAFARRRQRAA